MGTIELPCKSQFSTHGERTEGPPLADSQPFSSKNSTQLSVGNFASESSLAANSLLCMCHIGKLVPPDVTHVISFTRLPLFSRATLKRSGSLGTRLTIMNILLILGNTVLHIYNNIKVDIQPRMHS